MHAHARGPMHACMPDVRHAAHPARQNHMWPLAHARGTHAWPWNMALQPSGPGPSDTGQARSGSRPRTPAHTHARVATQAAGVKPFLSFLDALVVHISEGGKVISGCGPAFARLVQLLYHCSMLCYMFMLYVTVVAISIRSSKFRTGLFNDDRLAGQFKLRTDFADFWNRR
jgi:hypothetical protein